MLCAWCIAHPYPPFLLAPLPARYGSSNLLFMALTIMVPLGNFAFTLPFVPGNAPLHATDIIGLVIIMTGLVCYRFASYIITNYFGGTLCGYTVPQEYDSLEEDPAAGGLDHTLDKNPLLKSSLLHGERCKSDARVYVYVYVHMYAMCVCAEGGISLTPRPRPQLTPLLRPSAPSPSLHLLADEEDTPSGSKNNSVESAGRYSVSAHAKQKPKGKGKGKGKGKDDSDSDEGLSLH